MPPKGLRVGRPTAGAPHRKHSGLLEVASEVRPGGHPASGCFSCGSFPPTVPSAWNSLTPHLTWLTPGSHLSSPLLVHLPGTSAAGPFGPLPVLALFSIALDHPARLYFPYQHLIPPGAHVRHFMCLFTPLADSVPSAQKHFLGRRICADESLVDWKYHLPIRTK